MSVAPIVSVLVPVRGAASFLVQAIDSLRAQSFVDWDAWLCPLDAPAQAAIATAQADDPRVHVCARVTEHAAVALATAAEQARGDYLCVLDGDDLLDSTALAVMLAALKANPGTGMVYSQHVLVDADGAGLGPGPLCELPYSPEALLLDFMTGPLQLMRRDAYLGAGGFTPAHPDAADYDLCLRLSETTVIAHVPQALYRRRVHPQSPAVLRWVERIEANYSAFVAAVHRRGLDARYECALQVDSWHVLQPLRPFGGVGNWR